MAKLKVGRPDTVQDISSTTPGTHQGNSKGNYQKNKGFNPDGTVTAAASTGMDPKGHGPIDKRMPNLPPA
jgi:hypothetical protein